MPSLAGQELDKYAVLEEVGHGGMAVVYRGRDQVLDREVAVKVLHPHLADREESRQRLRREALTVAKLRHENIVEIYDYSGPDADESYIVTEFIHGQTLRDWFDSKWEPHPVVAAMVMYRLCLALDHAHAIGVVHRDIKPENVMIRRDGCLKLMDFGIAQILDQQKLTMTGQLLGSPAYMAPELICGKPVDKRTDLFACGVLLYQLATGHLPFSGRNPHEVLHKISDANYQPASQTNPKVDDALSDLIDKALAQEPVDRFQSARSMANDLEDYLRRFDIEPDDVDLAAYFGNPQVFLDELDQRLSAVLLQKAAAETKAGNRARALGLLAQVIELDPDNKDAQAMIGDVKARGRRIRFVAFVASGLAVAGLVVAGVMLARAARNDPKVASIERDGRDPMPKRGVASIPFTKPNRSADAGKAGASEGAAATSGPAGTGAAAATGGGKIRTLPVSPKIRTVGPAKALTNCTIEVKNMGPLDRRKPYTVAVLGGMKFELNGKTTVTVKADFRKQEHVTAVLRSDDKDARLRGSTRLSADKCENAKTVELSATLPATKVKFAVSPSSPVKPASNETTIECVSGCWDGHKKRMTKKIDERFEFSDFPERGELDFRFTVNAPGVDPNQRHVATITEGDDLKTITLRLEPR